jgi:hypothetical protein
MIAQHRRILFLIGMLFLFLGMLLFLRFRYFDETFSPLSIQQTIESGEASSNVLGIYKWTADTSLYHFTSSEGRMPTRSDFFQKDFLLRFPMKVGEWEGEDIANQYADISLFRLYQHSRSRENIWLIAVYGSHQSEFHSAEVCYISDGWDVARREIKRVHIDKDSFPIRYFIAQKGGNIHLVSYWYIWPSPRREVSEGTLLFRISVEGYSSEEKAESSLIDFMEAFLNLNVTGKQPKTKAAARRILPPSALPPVRAPVPEKTPHPFGEAKEKVIAWILSQRVPNSQVRLPELSRRYLLLSYELNRDQPKTENDKSYRYIFSRSAIYDNAIGLIALSQSGYFHEAESIIDAFERVMQGDGRFWFSYNTHDDWPSKWNHDEAIIRNGASAWAGYAITYHIRRRMLEDPGILERDENLKRYLKMAKKIADAILEDQVLDPKDFRYGLVTGGEGAHAMVKDEKTNRVIEKFHAGKVEWASIEHNLDIFFLLKNLSLLTGEKKYKEAERLMKQALEVSAWNKGEGQYNRGVRKGDVDTSQALDCASWGLLFALSLGDQAKVERLASAMERYAIIDPLHKIRGYRPYYRGYVYDELEINRLIYPHKPDKSWSDIEMVWSEGSLGVAMAYLKAGKIDKAKEIIAEMIKMQTLSGGVLYSTREVPFQFSPSPSMAGSAWLAMAVQALEDSRLRQLFWE